MCCRDQFNFDFELAWTVVVKPVFLAKVLKGFEIERSLFANCSNSSLDLNSLARRFLSQFKNARNELRSASSFTVTH